MTVERQTDRQTDTAVRRIDASERVRMANIPMTLDVGRFNAADARSSLTLVLAVLGVSCLGALVVVAAAPHNNYQTVSDLSGFRQVAWWFGIVVSLLAFGVALVALHVTVTEWRSYQRRLEEWHTATIEAYQDAGGQEVERAVSVFELTDASPAHTLLVALAVQQSITQGSQSKPWSVSNLEGDVWLKGSRGNLVKIGVVSPSGSERFGKRLAELGLVEGRKNRSAGRWLPESTDQVVTLIADNWAKVPDHSS